MGHAILHRYECNSRAFSDFNRLLIVCLLARSDLSGNYDAMLLSACMKILLNGTEASLSSSVKPVNTFCTSPTASLVGVWLLDYGLELLLEVAFDLEFI